MSKPDVMEESKRISTSAPRSGSAEAITAPRLAECLARFIFEIGDEPDSPCTRIQFKGGKWPDNERNQGGIAENPLRKELEKKLTEWGCPPNAEVSEGGTRDSRIETAAQSRPSLH
jgi:hypothetical protein